jgi:hypothetical protein
MLPSTFSKNLYILDALLSSEIVLTQEIIVTQKKKKKDINLANIM